MSETIEYEIEYITPTNEEEYINVEFEGSLITENDGIGGYEYWGFKGYDEGEDYLVCEEITWDKSLYNEHENATIKQFVNENYDKIADKIIDTFEKSHR